MEKSNRVKAVISLDAVEENFRQNAESVYSDILKILLAEKSSEE